MSYYRYPALVKLNGVILTDESRQPLSESRDERSVIVDLASGKKRKFMKEIKRKWSINWENVAMDTAHTVDGYGGRNEVRSLAQLGATMVLELRDGINISEFYTVFVDTYTETVLMRRPELFRYSMTLEISEQG